MHFRVNDSFIVRLSNRKHFNKLSANKSEIMFIIFGVAVLIAVCQAREPTLITRFDLNETYVENYTSDEQLIFPTIDPSIAEDATLTTPQLINKYGYKVEVHYVTTDDGYILQLHRITGGEKYPAKNGKKVCILQHGLLDSSATWILTGPGHGLGYLLADENMDVWLANSRGNTYSCNHTTYNPFGSSKDRKKFWDFSWDEMGRYDLPATIDYVLAETGQMKLQFVGHSQGTTAFFVMCSERPEYNQKIEMMHALAPIAFLSHVISPPIRVIAPFVSIISKISSFIGLNYITPNDEFLILAGKLICRDEVPTQIICENLLFLVMGYASDQLNATLLPVILGHTPAGSATNQMIQYGQEVNSGHFRQFDHGRIGNLLRYKRISPPDYNLNNVKVPVAVYYSQDDWLADVKDTEHLLKSLPNVINNYIVPHKKFNHIDFVWGIDAPFLLYDEIVKTMKLSNYIVPNMDIDIENALP
ncbi:lipase 3-like [Contarinia nasturtii]|uniref:lipase 3-like n=1 Tax=Contarinia nasturtii TaxID=265458 RepID=UPI0012D38370|nr:lipase 3-like [Contarinia nasturtii]